MQIAELIHGSGYNLVDLPQFYASAKRLRKTLSPYQRVFSPLRRNKRYGHSRTRGQNRKTLVKYWHARELIESQKDVSVLIWEFTQDHAALAAARSCNIPIVAMPHNVESLVENQRLSYCDKSGSHERFAAEMAHLALADHIVAISPRDQWLLGLFGLESSVLPYYPCSSRLADLQTVRERRSPGQGEARLLVMGSAFYKPTYEGMHHILKVIENSELPAAGVRVDIAGFGTTSLKRETSCEAFSFHGEVTNEKMLSLMANATACVLHQYPRTGSLTRIPDLLTAGIPIIANGNAARGFERISGIQIYENEREMIQCIKNIPTSLAPKYQYPEHEVKKFIDSIINNYNPYKSLFKS